MIGFLVQKVKAIAGHGACWNWGWIFCTCKRISWICCRCPSGDDFCTLRHENGLKLRLSTRAPTNSIFQTGIADSFSSFLYDKSRPRTRLDKNDRHQRPIIVIIVHKSRPRTRLDKVGRTTILPTRGRLAAHITRETIMQTHHTTFYYYYYYPF